MVIAGATWTGLQETRTYFGDVQKRLSKFVGVFPTRSGQIMKRHIYRMYKQGSYPRGKSLRKIGPYRRATGRGLSSNANMFQVVKTGRHQASVRVNPAFMAGGSKPAIYAGYVEYGTSKARPKYYFEKGIHFALKEYNDMINKEMDKIIRGNK